MQGEGGGALDFSFIFKSVCDGVRMYFILLCERGGERQPLKMLLIIASEYCLSKTSAKKTDTQRKPTIRKMGSDDLNNVNLEAS